MPDNSPETATTVGELIRRHAIARPDRTMVIDQDHRITYGELDERTRRLAAAFVAAGVGKGVRVGILMPNSTGWVELSVALTRIGAVIVPLSTLLQPPELVAQLRVASVQILVTVEEFRGRRFLDELGLSATAGPDLRDPELPALRQVWNWDRPIPAASGETATAVADALAATVCAADPLVVMFTSGSRSLPKAVLHSHGNAFAAVRSGLAARCVGPDTCLYLPMPFFWVGGFGGGVLSALLAGATLVTEQIPRPEQTLALLRREHVTLFRGWPDQAAALAHRAEQLDIPLPPLESGSLDALLPPERRARPGARANLFGMTESFGPYCGYPLDTDMPHPAWGSCGKPFPGMNVRIVNPDDGQPAPVGVTGHIHIRGPHILRGILRRSREEVFTADGYYPTGDLGHLDDTGFLFYHGRSDDMFKVSGATVYPSEVEAALRGIEGVRAAFATDIDGDGGKRVGAVVVLDGGPMTADELRDAVRRSLSAFKVPSAWVLLDGDDRVPRGATGKVDVAGLRALICAEGVAAGR